LSKG